MNRRRGLLAGGAVLLALLVIALLSQSRENRYERPPLDPRGTGPDGAAALVELLRAEGATVHLSGLPDEDDDVTLLLADTLGGESARDLRRWVETGGTLVVTDPGAALAPETTELGGPPPIRPGTCEIDAIIAAPVEVLDPGLPAVFPTGPSSSSCFTRSTGTTELAAIDLRREGDGLVAAVSTSLVFTNEVLDEADAAVLATALLAPGPGTDVRVIDPNRFYGDTEDVGDGTVLGALPPRGREAVFQLMIAFLAWALIRGRRLGQPVVEELPVPLPASDLVLASGRLLDRNGDVADAAERLRRRTRRDLGVAVGLGPDPHPRALADALGARAGLDAGLVHAALLAPVADEAALVATSAHLDRLRRELYQ